MQNSTYLFSRFTGYCCLIQCVFLFVFALQAVAAPTDDLRSITRQQEQILLQQQERERHQEELFLHKDKKKSVLEGPELLLKEEQDLAPCMQVVRIEFEGITLLPQAFLDEIRGSYSNQCLSVEGIKNILRDITNAYIKRGYVTARAFIDPNKESDGVLYILVIEGTVEKVSINGREKDYYYRGLTAFPGVAGNPLNLRDLEQGVDQLNRLPSQTASLDLVPGEELGGTVVQITIPEQRSWRVGGSIDNFGQRSSGQWLYGLFLEKDNALGLNDQWGAYWSCDAPFLERTIDGRKDEGDNHSFSLYSSIPWGYWTFSWNFSKFDYRTHIRGRNAQYTSRGDTLSQSFQAERVIHRDADSKTALAMALGTRNVKNYIEDIKLSRSSYRLTTATATATHQRRLLGGAFSSSFGYVQGLNVLGATKETGGDMPKSNFNKYTGMLSWYKPFEVHTQKLYYHVAGYGQLSEHTMRSSERIAIGSRYSVRGFHEQSATGDQGGYLRNELGVTLFLPQTWEPALPCSGVQVYTFYDCGAIIKDASDSYERGRLEGIGGGIRTLGDLALDFSIAKGLSAPEYISRHKTEAYCSIRYTF